MLEKRGCQQLVYPQNRTRATGEQSNFASSLIFLLLMYKGARKCKDAERSYSQCGARWFLLLRCLYINDV